MSLVSKSLLPLCGKVHRCSLLFEHLCKQGAVTIDEEDPILLVLGKSTPSNQLKLVRCCPSFEGVGGNSKGQAIPGMVLPTIIVGKVEYQGLGDTLANIVDVHHWATKLVTFWECEETTGNDGIAHLHISRSANSIWGYLHKDGVLLHLL